MRAQRAVARTENEGAYVKRLGEERDELASEVRALRDRVATQERRLAVAELERKRRNGLGDVVEPVLEKIIGLFRPK